MRQEIRISEIPSPLNISLRMNTEYVIRIPDWKPRFYLQFCQLYNLEPVRKNELD